MHEFTLQAALVSRVSERNISENTSVQFVSPCLFLVQYLVQTQETEPMPNTVCNYSEARRKLKSLMDQAVDDRTPITITRKSGEPVVLVAQSEFNAMEETLHLLRTPANASRLLESLAQVEGNSLVEVVSTRESIQVPPPK